MLLTTLCYVEKDGCYLMMLRNKKENDPSTGKWIGAGGKVEPGETKQQALVRECQEELAITLDVGELFMDVTHEYPDLMVHLTLFHATIREGVPQKLEHNDIRWITVGEIDQYEFCPADETILNKLRKEYKK